METEFNQTPSLRRFLPLIVILLVLGWGGLFLLMNTTQPNLGPRWMFFFLLVVGIPGSASDRAAVPVGRDLCCPDDLVEPRAGV